MIPLAFLSHLRLLGILMTGAYALINVILELLAPLTEGWTHWTTTLLAVPVMVLGMVHLIQPLSRRMLGAGKPAAVTRVDASARP